MKKHLTLFLLAALLFVFCLARPAAAQNAPGLLIPMGGGYSDVYAGFSAAALSNAKNNTVKILVLPGPYASNPQTISAAERATNLKDAEERRYQIEEACKRAAPPTIRCQAVLAPLFTRSDAEDPAVLSLLSDDLTAVFILGGDQTVAMLALAGSAAETRLSELHQQGIIFAGTSAGGGMQSAAMMAGYNPNYAADNALSFGAADVWHSPEKHGLPFGLQNAILDQHFQQRGRLGRLLNAILQPGAPHLGLGVDAYTGLLAQDENLSGVFGLYTVSVLDAETYHAADGVRYVQAEEGRPPLLSARNILVSLLSPGDFSYNLKTRAASLAAPAPRLKRRFEALTPPPGAGALFLAGDLSASLTTFNPVLAAFSGYAKTNGGHWAVIAIGYPSEASAQRAIAAYSANSAPQQVTAILVPANDPTPIQLPEGLTGILLIGKDQSKANVAALQPVRQAWLTGVPVLADNAAAPLLGAFYSAHGPTPKDAEEAELATQKSFWQGKTEIRPGLALINLTLEPQLLADNRFGRWFSLAYNHPDLLAIGLNRDTALEISADGARVIGGNDILTLDLRSATLALGTNNGFVIANGLLDLFAPGEKIAPAAADVNAAFTPAPTPNLAAPTATLAPTLLPTASALPTASVAFPTATTTSAAESAPSAPWGLLFGLGLMLAAALAAKFLRQRQ
ncbi:MAG: Type 1 glutamine amidotransferase-like domain-containing protein [Anaerolineales bacterium]